MKFWRSLAEHLSGNQSAVLGIVGDHTRHSPGTRGAKMYVRPNGSQFGTIGGGIMEAELLRQAPQIRGQSTEVLHHRADAEGARSGLICAGNQTMVYVVAQAADAAIYREFADAVDGDLEVRLVLEAGTPRVEPAPVGDGPPISLVEGTYAEHAVNHHRVAIAGGGHCGLALSRTLRHLDYHVTVFEVRDDVFTFVENEFAHNLVVVEDYSEAGPLVRFPQLTHFVVMTANADADVRALSGALTIGLPYLGVMGSPAKLSKIRADLLTLGFDEHALDALYAPIGLEMTSNTPPEIAISVSAQILRERTKLFPWSRPAAADS